MQAPINCPSCGEYRLHQSRARNNMEKMMKRFLPYKLYRCHNCNWRGWIPKRKLKVKANPLKTGFFYLGVILLALIVGYMMKYILQ